MNFAIHAIYAIYVNLCLLTQVKVLSDNANIP